MRERDVFVVRFGGPGAPEWTKIGVCVEELNGTETVHLRALPLDGKLVIGMPSYTRRQQAAHARREP